MALELFQVASHRPEGTHLLVEQVLFLGELREHRLGALADHPALTEAQGRFGLRVPADELPAMVEQGARYQAAQINFKLASLREAIQLTARPRVSSRT